MSLRVEINSKVEEFYKKLVKEVRKEMEISFDPYLLFFGSHFGGAYAAAKQDAEDTFIIKFYTDKMEPLRTQGKIEQIKSVIAHELEHLRDYRDDENLVYRDDEFFHDGPEFGHYILGLLWDFSVDTRLPEKYKFGLKLNDLMEELKEQQLYSEDVENVFRSFMGERITTKAIDALKEAFTKLNVKNKS